MSIPETRKEVSREILRYLLRHPEAQDTLEGISEWWLLEETIIRKYAEVEAALTNLVDQGFVLEKRVVNLGTLYCLNRIKTDQIKKLVREESEL
jgi:hypothetical protein